jgi:group I intron endonuclease
MRCIYAILNTITCNQYIGSTKNSYIRKRNHFNLLRKKKHHSIVLQRAFDKHGENKFKFIVLEEVDENINLIEREQWWLDNANCIYNSSKNALPGKERIITEETREKMRKSHLGVKHPEWRRKQKSEYQKGKGIGRKYSEESKKKMSEAHKKLYMNGYEHPLLGKKQKKESIEKIIFKKSKPVLQFDSKDNFIKKWKSQKEIKDVLGYKNINACLKGIRSLSYGYKWKYEW